MKSSTVSTPWRSMCERTRVAWLAMASIIRRLVRLNHRLFLKKSAWPKTWAMTSFCSTGALAFIRYAYTGLLLITSS